MEFLLKHWPVFLWLSLGKIVAVVFVTVVTDLPYFKARRIYTHRAIERSQWNREWRGVLLAPTDAIVLIVLVLSDFIRISEEVGLGTHLKTILVMILWVDFWMYFVHRVMHKSPLLWKIHRHHHLSIIAQPATALSFSFCEKFFFYSTGWLVGVAAISRFFPISFEGIIAYFSIYYFLSAASHGNTDYFKDHLGLLQSPPIHGLHHVKPSVNYGFWTTIYDRIFGTYRSPSVEENRRSTSQ